MTTELTKAAQQALDTLKQLQGGCTDSGDGTVEAITVWCPEVIEALERALTQRPAAQTERDILNDSAWIAGAKFGWNCGVEGTRDLLNQCIEQRIKDRVEARASLPAPQQATSHVETDWISNVIRDVSELPDRSSPDDEPDMMLVTAAELRSILETHAPQQATPEPVGEQLQGGLDNDALLNAWLSKLPGVTPTDAEMTAFALGVEVGFAHARTLERSDWSRVHEALQAAGVHPGRTDDHLADVIAKALANRPAPGVPEDSELLDYLDTLAARPAGSDLHCFGGRVVLYVRTGIGSQIEASGAGTAREAIRAALAAAQAKGAGQ